MTVLEKTERKLGMQFPQGYRTWQVSGYFKGRFKQSKYLWLHEAEWIPLAEIPGYDLWRITIPGLIPFAFNAAGDHWCFSTRKPTSPGEFEIWFCPHDEELGETYAPTFPAWFYRNCLAYASGGFDEDPHSIKEAKSNLRTWSKRLAEIQPGKWAEHLGELADKEPVSYKHPKLRTSVPLLFGFITAMDVDQIVQAEFGKRYFNRKVKWGTIPEDD
jgi:hypothetical protein